jgi:hypothetical protein
MKNLLNKFIGGFGILTGFWAAITIYYDFIIPEGPTLENVPAASQAILLTVITFGFLRGAIPFLRLQKPGLRIYEVSSYLTAIYIVIKLVTSYIAIKQMAAGTIDIPMSLFLSEFYQHVILLFVYLIMAIKLRSSIEAA